MDVGIPYAPISAAYSLLSSDFGKLRAIIDLLTPGLVFANDGGPFARAIYATVPDEYRAGGDAQSAGRPQDHDVRRSDRRRRRRRRRRRAAPGHARHHRQIPVHLRLDRHAQGRHQHPPHAVLEPGDDRRRLRLRRRRAAGGGGLAALEPHLRQQPQLQHGAGQRRLALHRRRQSDAAGRAEDRAQSARDRADHLFQRAQGLRGAGAAFPRRRGAAQEFLQPAEGAVLCRRRPEPDHLGRPHRARDRDHRRAHHLPVVARLDRDLAAGARLLVGFRPAGQYRAAGAGRRTQAGAERRQTGSAAARSAHHARLLAAGCSSRARPSTKTASTRSATR